MLTALEIQRKNELYAKYVGTGHLTYFEAQELKDLINRDTTLEEGAKLLIIFALVAMIVYAASKS